jgi:excinuclease UvrABC nuclease subunit
MPDDIAWLKDRGFEPVGRWSGLSNKLEHLTRIARAPGVYVFVVNGMIRYIGKASRLRSRLRQYNRSFKHSERPLRRSHRGISEIVEDRGAVDVWVFNYSPNDNDTIDTLETKWIWEKDPEWNGSGRPSKTI